jgi:CheY-like chemotaxis protein
MSANIDKKAILLVEDDVILLEIALERGGVDYPVFTVPDGSKAMGYLGGEPPYQDRSRYPFPALVLLDVKVPAPNGFEVLRWIRGRPEFENLPVVVLSGSDDPWFAVTASQLGATAFFAKSEFFMTQPVLGRAIKKLLQA